MDSATSKVKQNGVIPAASEPEAGTDKINEPAGDLITTPFQDVCLGSDDQSAVHPDAASPSAPCSSDSEDAMYSVGSTPAGTPVRVPKSHALTLEEQDVLIQMESQNELLQKLQSLEQRYELRDREFEEEKTVLEIKLKDLEDKLTSTREEKDQTIAEIRKDMNQRVDQLTKQLNSARKELESMVMKYASSEKQILDANKRKDLAEKHLKEVIRDKESLSGRVKALTSDKSSLTSALDKKITELAIHQKEIDRLTSEVKDKETKLKQGQQKLQITIDAHDEAKEQLVNLNNVLDVLKKELEHSKHDELQTTEQSDNAVSAAVAKEPVESNDTSVDHAAVNELLRSELESTKDQKQSLEEKILELRKLLEEMRMKDEEHKQTRYELQKVTSDLSAQQQQNQDIVSKLKEISTSNNELQHEVDLYRQKEAEMHDLSERQNERVKSYQIQIQNLEQECQTWRERVQVLDDKLQEDMRNRKDLLDKHDQQVSRFQERIKKLEEELNQSQCLAQQLKNQVDEIQNDKRIISKKQTNAVKELNKEVAHLRKKLQLMESQPHSGPASSAAPYLSVAPVSDALSANSRTSSSSSIDLIGQSAANSRDTPQTQEQVSSDSRSEENADPSAASESSNMDAISSLPDLDKGKLVERILKLQKTLAKRSEKMDFLEDHNHQLVEELKKKTRLIQYYLLREESGALTTAEMDRNKRELLKKGSTTIMSSLYKNTCESEMTLDLSLEINRKLQAVLEDTILKNITLKDSLSTLGDEIARLNGKPPDSIPSS